MTDVASHPVDATAPGTTRRGGLGQVLAVLLALLALVGYGIPGVVIFFGILAGVAQG